MINFLYKSDSIIVIVIINCGNNIIFLMGFKYFIFVVQILLEREREREREREMKSKL